MGNNMDRDRRKYPRTAVSCPARILDDRRRLLVRGKTVDVSAGGVKILGPVTTSPVAGARVAVELELLLPGADKPREVLRDATVRRVEAMGDWTSVVLEFVKTIEM